MTDPSQTPTIAEISHKLTMLARYHSDHREAEAVAEEAIDRMTSLSAEVERLRAGIREHRVAIEREYQTTKDTAAHHKLWSLLDGVGEDS